MLASTAVVKRGSSLPAQNQHLNGSRRRLRLGSELNESQVTLTHVRTNHVTRSLSVTCHLPLQDLHITGPGTIDGQGKWWWNQCLIGRMSYGVRPSLLGVYYSSDVSVTSLSFVNGPRFHLWLQQNERVEVGWVNVTVDRTEVKRVKKAMQEVRAGHDDAGSGGFAGGAGAPGEIPRLQPTDLNTDGIDPSGRDYWIHDCVIANDDDSIAVWGKGGRGGGAER